MLGGDRRGLAEVLADTGSPALAALPVRTFPDIPEPRRAVLDEIAARSLSVEITIRTAIGTSRPHGTVPESPQHSHESAGDPA